MPNPVPFPPLRFSSHGEFVLTLAHFDTSYSVLVDASNCDAVTERKDITVCLTGQKDVIEKELSKYTYKIEQIEIVDAPEVIETGEPPVNAIRKKKNSSLVVGLNLVKSGEADGFVSAGSSGAVLVGGQVIVGRVKGVERPPLAPLIPTEKGVSLLIDCGANVAADAGAQCYDNQILKAFAAAPFLIAEFFLLYFYALQTTGFLF